MSYGVITQKPCPVCETPLDYVDFDQAPPPIPPSPQGGYAGLNRFVNDEGSRLTECPKCEADLL